MKKKIYTRLYRVRGERVRSVKKRLLIISRFVLSNARTGNSFGPDLLSDEKQISQIVDWALNITEQIDRFGIIHL